MGMLDNKCIVCKSPIKSPRDFFIGDMITCLNGHTIGFFKKESWTPEKEHIKSKKENMSRSAYPKKLSPVTTRKRQELIDSRKKIFEIIEKRRERYNVCSKKLDIFMKRQVGTYAVLKSGRYNNSVYEGYLKAIVENHSILKKEPYINVKRSGDFFVKNRQSFNMTRNQFADFCGLIHSNYSKIERCGIKNIGKSGQFSIISKAYEELKKFKTTDLQAKVLKKRLSMLGIPPVYISDMSKVSKNSIIKAFYKEGASIQTYMEVDRILSELESDPDKVKNLLKLVRNNKVY